MLPNGILSTDITLKEVVSNTKTYKLSDDIIQGFVDEYTALKQAIYKALNTEKYEYPIYSFSYGIDLESLTGKDPAYVKIELQRRIRECLLQDKRIQSVDDFSFKNSGDNLVCTFEVISIYGTSIITKEVAI